MKCPACGREMEPGYLQSDRPVVFTTRRPSLSGVAFPRIPRGKDLHLTNDAYSPCACPAWHCPQCRHILVERQTHPGESFPQEAPDVWKTEGGTWRPL